MTPSAVPYNGWIDVSAIRMSKFLGVLKGLHMLLRRRILNFELVEPYRTTEIEIESVGGAKMGIDGRIFAPTFPLQVAVMPEKLNLIIQSLKIFFREMQMVARGGIEPPTHGFSIRCSTD